MPAAVSLAIPDRRRGSGRRDSDYEVLQSADLTKVRGRAEAGNAGSVPSPDHKVLSVVELRLTVEATAIGCQGTSFAYNTFAFPCESGHGETTTYALRVKTRNYLPTRAKVAIVIASDGVVNASAVEALLLLACSAVRFGIEPLLFGGKQRQLTAFLEGSATTRFIPARTSIYHAKICLPGAEWARATEVFSTPLELRDKFSALMRPKLDLLRSRSLEAAATPYKEIVRRREHEPGFVQTHSDVLGCHRHLACKIAKLQFDNM